MCDLRMGYLRKVYDYSHKPPDIKKVLYMPDEHLVAHCRDAQTKEEFPILFTYKEFHVAKQLDFTPKIQSFVPGEIHRMNVYKTYGKYITFYIVRIIAADALVAEDFIVMIPEKMYHRIIQRAVRMAAIVPRKA